MLEIRDLHVQFHGSDHEAVRGIDLTVGDGEIVGLVGESGSGKTVTAMMISGLLRLPGSPALRLGVDGDGPLSDWKGKVTAAVDGRPTLTIDATHRIDAGLRNLRKFFEKNSF